MKLKASTLIESIVALTIISIVFAISIIIFMSVTNAGYLNQKIIAHQIIQSMISETKSQKKYFEESLSRYDIQFFKTVETVNEKGLIKLSIRSVDKNGKLLEEYNEYIISDEEN